MPKYKDGQRLGDYRVICDRSGMKVWASECRRTWEGFFVREKDWEPRNQQDFVRGRVDRQTVSPTRPEQTDNFITSADIGPEDL